MISNIIEIFDTDLFILISYDPLNAIFENQEIEITCDLKDCLLMSKKNKYKYWLSVEEGGGLDVSLRMGDSNN